MHPLMPCSYCSRLSDTIVCIVSLVWCPLLSESLLWRHNGDECVSNCQPHDCLLNRLFGRWSKKTSKLRVTGLCAGNSPETGEFPAQMASNAENVSIWWRHHDSGSNEMCTRSVMLLPTSNSFRRFVCSALLHWYLVNRISYQWQTPQFQWNNHLDMIEIDQHQTTRIHNKAWRVCISFWCTFYH